MASIFKRNRKKGTPYTIQYLDHVGERKTVKGFTDKGLSEQLAARLEHDARLRRSGLIDVEAEKYSEQRNAPLASHVAAFEESISECSSQYILHVRGRLNKVIEGCGFEKLADFKPEPIETYLRARRQAGLGPRTSNHYLQTVQTFLNWCVATGRSLSNPLLAIERVNEQVDVRHQRRALSSEEFAKLVNSARSSETKTQCFDGETRARIYILAYMTGLRRKELGSLTKDSFDLDGNPPTLTVAAASSKHRKKDTLPLHSDLVPLLKDWLSEIDGPLFPKLARRKTWLMVKKDLERVGIPYETDQGIADFHAAGRHTHITELLRNGATLPEAQKLARHSDVKMTMRYTHIGLADQARAIENLPALQMRCISGVSEGQQVAADGTASAQEKSPSPNESKDLGIVCRQVSQGDKVEDRGLEPLTFWLPARRSPN